MHIFSEVLIVVLSRIFVAIIALTAICTPLVLLSFVEAYSSRLILVIVSNALFVTISSLLAKQRVGEVFAAGAT